jgi:hypothetical protein
MRADRMRGLLFAAALIAQIALAQAPTQINPAPLVDPAPFADVPNLNGVWNVEYIPNIEARIGGPLPFTDIGQAAWDNLVLGEDPTGYCHPSGIARVFHTPFPLQIIQTRGQVTFLFEVLHTWHRVFTDGREHPDPLGQSWWGHSIGHYEDNKLIVDTIGMNDRTWLYTSGVQHSDKLHLTQVFELVDPDTIRYTITYDDPVFFTEAWSVTSEFQRSEYDLLEYICTENNRDLDHFVVGDDED